MSKVYIAARYDRRFELRFAANAIRSNGHEVTAQWLDNAEEEKETEAEAAQMDVDDVLRADTVLFIGEPKGSANRGGGRWFELGLAYAYGKRIFFVPGEGGSETVFTALPEIASFETVEKAILEL